jgi:hypothetical protein
MPWSPNDGPSRHTKKASTPKKKKQWSAVANSILARTGNEGRAVRGANAAVAHATYSAHAEKRMRHARRKER